MHVTVGHHDLGAHGLQAAQVDVHRPRADRATAGQRHRGLAEVGHHRPQHQDRGAHGFNQLVGRGELLDGGGVHLHVELVVDHHVHAHAAEQLDQGGHVLQVGQIAHRDRLPGQQGGGQDRQR